MGHHHYTLLADATGETIKPKKEKKRQKTQQQRHCTVCVGVLCLKALWMDKGLLNDTELAC